MAIAKNVRLAPIHSEEEPRDTAREQRYFEAPITVARELHSDAESGLPEQESELAVSSGPISETAGMSQIPDTVVMTFLPILEP